jgi:hypothetical protein
MTLSPSGRLRVASLVFIAFSGISEKTVPPFALPDWQKQKS